MGFIGYQVLHQDAPQAPDDAVRIYLECQDETDGEVSYTFAVDVVFPKGAAPCVFRGIGQVLVLKKFYKLVFSLEERAREHGNPPQRPLESCRSLIEHLCYTRNARDVGGDKLACRAAASAQAVSAGE